jgi:hypothetical protein
MVTLCCVSSSLAPTTPAQIRLNRNWLILLPQVTVNEMVLPLAIVRTPAEATTTAVVKAAMRTLREEICRRDAAALILVHDNAHSDLRLHGGTSVIRK